ncbi:MAG TPA: peptidyl-prolyl cis-trans isomerase [Gemmatimonadaceae bacterium]|nr:peptidyl-prolyl cis-trans isomerase [Gemmatimonadaceae bacterium]
MLQSMRSAAKYIWIFLVIFFVGGFLLAETSGLLGRAPVTSSTAVATVNGEDVLATTWYNAINQLEQQATQQTGRSVTLDERKRLADDAFEQLVGDVLLRQEYRRRGIRVTSDEISEAAQYAPPPQLAQSPELQTDGRFDPAKYQRFLASPAARQEGILLQLEAYYRDQIPREKLFEQVAADVYVSDDRLWNIWRDTRDTAQMSYVAFRPELIADNEVTVPASEIKDYYEKNKKDFERPARAVVSVVSIPRAVTAADTAATRNRLIALRDRILKGEKFEDVAKAESTDSVSASNGGFLGRGVKGRFVPEFENAAYALKVGEVSQPVLTPFGYHLIKVDEHKGDTIAIRHILLPITQGDSAATATDRRADELAKIAASSDKPGVLDEAARTLGLKIKTGKAVETDPLTIDGKFVPSVGPWAFQGAKIGETSELFDAEDGYYLGRLDSLTKGGIPSLEEATPEVKAVLIIQKKLDKLMPRATQFASNAAKSSLEEAASGAGMSVVQSPPFTRVGGVEGVGRLNQAVGAAFSLPIGVVSAPIRVYDGIFVERVNTRKLTAKDEWEKQKVAQRASVTQQLRQQRVRDFLQNLRENATVVDRRKEIEAAQRQLAQ